MDGRGHKTRAAFGASPSTVNTTNVPTQPALQERIAANQLRFTASSLSGRGIGNRYGTTALIYRTER